MAGEAHPVPSRIRKLSPRAPIVLRVEPVGDQDAAGRLGAFSPGGAPRRARGPFPFEETLPGTVGQTVSALALPKGDSRRRGHAYASASGATIYLATDASSNVITFTYSDDASHAYVVHLWDEATGLPVAADISFDSVEALLDYLAHEVPGYYVLFGGRGYLSARDGCKELTFWYELDPEPAAPAESAMPSAPAAAGAIGLGAAALGALLRRRRED